MKRIYILFALCVSLFTEVLIADRDDFNTILAPTLFGNASSIVIQ